MDGQEGFNQPWNNPSYDPSRGSKKSKGSHFDASQHVGAPPPASTSPYTPTTASVPPRHLQPHVHSHEHHGGHQTPMFSGPSSVAHTVLKPRGLEGHPAQSEQQRWVPGENGGSRGRPPHVPPNEFSLDLQPQPHTSGHPPFDPSVALGSIPQPDQYCRIPGCPNKAYYNFAESEQTEYCGHGHELQAITTGLVNSCAMCKQRPRRRGERVCGRICREREAQSTQRQGLYYGVPVVRHERPGT